MEYAREHDDSKRKSKHSECNWKPVNRILSSKVWPTLSRSCKDRLPPKVVNQSLKKKWKKVKSRNNPFRLPNNRRNYGLALMVSTVIPRSSLPCKAYSHLIRLPSNRSKRRSSSRSRRKKILSSQHSVITTTLDTIYTLSWFTTEPLKAATTTHSSMTASKMFGGVLVMSTYPWKSKKSFSRNLSEAKQHLPRRLTPLSTSTSTVKTRWSQNKWRPSSWANSCRFQATWGIGSPWITTPSSSNMSASSLPRLLLQLEEDLKIKRGKSRIANRRWNPCCICLWLI